MPEFEIKSRFQYQDCHVNLNEEESAPDEDMFMEKILNNLNSTPIGQVLKKIASLPEVRKDKVMNVRQQLTDGKYELNNRLNLALDKVLEDLTA